MTLESPLYELLNKKLSPLEEFLGRGDEERRKGTSEAEKIIE
jgi:hypothetical protein